MNPTSPHATIYIVDDNEAVRDSIQWLLEGHGFKVCGFDSAETFLAKYDPTAVACLLLDIRMKGDSGLALQDRLLELNSPLPLAFITGHGDVPMAVETMKKGASDFLQKPFEENTLMALIDRMIIQAEEVFAQHQQSVDQAQLLAKLTKREAQVLERIVAGRLNKQIADDFGVSIKTVEAHRANLMSKLDVKTVADLLKLVLGSSADHH